MATLLVAFVAVASPSLAIAIQQDQSDAGLVMEAHRLLAKQFFDQERVNHATMLNAALTGAASELAAHGVEWRADSIAATATEAQAGSAFTGKFAEAVAAGRNAGVSSRALANAARRALAASLSDSHTRFVDATGAELLRENQLVGEYHGIGATLAKAGGDFIYIDQVFPDSPAKKAGVRRLHRVVSVNGKAVDGGELNSDLAAVIGEVNSGRATELTLTDGERRYSVNIVHAAGKVPLATSEVIERGGKRYGYVRVTSFMDYTGLEFFGEIFKLMDISRWELGKIQDMIDRFSEGDLADARRPLQELVLSDIDGLIIDLRGNPGGAVLFCYLMASAFLPEDSEVMTMRSDAALGTSFPGLELPEEFSQRLPPEGYTMTTPTILSTITLGVLPLSDSPPLVVLIDGRSGSASEIAAAAFQDHHRATIVGTTSARKCNAGKMEQLSDGSMLMVTVAEVRRPNGNVIEGEGVRPDRVIEMNRDDVARGADSQLEAAIRELSGKR